MTRHEERACQICIKIFYLPTTTAQISEDDRIVLTTNNIRVEVGAYFDRFCNMITKERQEQQCDLSDCG